MKKIRSIVSFVSALICLLMVCSLAVEAKTPLTDVGDNIIYDSMVGDINEDDDINAEDLGYLRNVIIGLSVDFKPELTDINGDKKIDILDIIRFKKYFANTGSIV